MRFLGRKHRVDVQPQSKQGRASSVSKVPTLLACRHENKKRSKNAHFSFEERVKIETYIDEGLSKRKIAERLCRTPKAVRKEIARNSVRGRYCALKAQMKSYQRRWRIQKDVLKIAVNSLLQKYVETHLKQYWSPESISGRLRYVDRHLPYVGKDAIYAYVASVHGRSLERYLWWKGKKYKPRIPREVILNRTMIDERYQKALILGTIMATGRATSS